MTDHTIHNEQVKLFANFINAIAIGTIGFAVLRPLVEGLTGVSLLWGATGFALHGASHYILGYLRKDRDDDPV